MRSVTYTGPGPEPWDPDTDSTGARRQAEFDRTSARLARERRERADRDFRRRYGPPEGRHQGHDDGEHHWRDAFPSPAAGLWKPGPARCGCGCEDSDPPARGTPVDGLLDELSRQRDADPYTAYERGRAEARSAAAAARGPMTAF